ncbi:hypothetical protein ACFY89_05375 [Achromobacter spanius]|uniref:hypothetical protein n=1 Tax=Achromobacter spanius TaxID=217203 RepID=UPI0036EA0FC6
MWLTLFGVVTLLDGLRALCVGVPVTVVPRFTHPTGVVLWLTLSGVVALLDGLRALCVGVPVTVVPRFTHPTVSLCRMGEAREGRHKKNRIRTRGTHHADDALWLKLFGL